MRGTIMVDFSILQQGYQPPSVAGMAREGAGYEALGDINRKEAVRREAGPLLAQGDYAGATQAAYNQGDLETGAGLEKMQYIAQGKKLERDLNIEAAISANTYRLSMIPDDAARKAAALATVDHLTTLMEPEEAAKWKPYAIQMMGDFSQETLLNLSRSSATDLAHGKLRLDEYKATLTQGRDEETARWHQSLEGQRRAALEERQTYHKGMLGQRGEELRVREDLGRERIRGLERLRMANESYRNEVLSLRERQLQGINRYREGMLRDRKIRTARVEAPKTISDKDRMGMAMRYYNTTYPLSPLTGARPKGAPPFEAWFQNDWPKVEQRALGAPTGAPTGSVTPMETLKARTVNVGGQSYPIVSETPDGFYIVDTPQGQRKVRAH